ncbi:hypothetical protein BN59_01922 [Legionella massiliensis]|uniref:TfuA-like core domain-containing protein n=1 Tax=Legionella massiliensis TaxID=1034943 RepID=A0A078L0S9_9GAMM|nr:TfuA-like protein [Legionella massiliensis]CDZ77638.1 hypothetical protein BN59_01922 [Legionella massiliensis]CEE13376.1 TfuA-like protein [Legionella massiliensis]
MPQLHVFLGPSLDLEHAQKILPNGHFHPPIQCGDIIRLMRLNPQTIVIIDGLYETTPAVWHKEILLALEAGIAVWGAASMGALRAAELHFFGMRGIGEIFHAFKDGKLSDDDEVAVLHLSKKENYQAINEAMVNIRATCELACSQGLLAEDAKNNLINYCKSQFYPYRSLKKAIQHFAKSAVEDYSAFALWLDKEGIVDLKRKDAIMLLEHLQQVAPQQIPAQSEPMNPMTCFLRELIFFANTTPFNYDAAWLPEKDKLLQELHKQSPLEYMLVAELATFLQRLAIFSSQDKKLIDNAVLLDYIEKNQLYSPEIDFTVCKDHPHLIELYSLICQAICLNHLKTETLEEYLPAIAHYYALPQALVVNCQQILRAILVIIFSINQHLELPGLSISPKLLSHHLKQIKNWRHYSTEQFKHWLHETPVSRQIFKSFLYSYIQTSSVYLLGTIKMNYYQWIYDAYSIHNQTRLFSLLSREEVAAERTAK